MMGAAPSFLPVDGNLSSIRHFDTAGTRELPAGVRVTVMYNAENPLYGPTGAAHVFGPQKGADQRMVRELDSQLRALDQMFCRELGKSFAETPGAGTAGDLEAGCMAFLRSRL